ncbi:MAG TPA: biotin/lipoyl-containing protein [Aggregatilineales bacterium]|nr:biotin/lipoyl-containing protein [Aggregatilineales bacterium]
MKYRTTVNGQTYDIEIDQEGRIQVNGEERHVDFQTISSSLFSVIIDNASYEALIEQHEGQYLVQVLGDLYEAQVSDERRERLARSAGVTVVQGEISIRSPMPGLIVAVAVTVGQEVSQGDPLAVLESMKMENEIKAPRGGTVKQVHVSKGDRVEQNKPLVTIA